MLSVADNELMTRVGPGTSMGQTLREYWVPVMRSEELPDPDGDPLRVRLLGENLVMFRATDGRIGLLKEACPHRGASLFARKPLEIGGIEKQHLHFRHLHHRGNTADYSRTNSEPDMFQPPKSTDRAH